MPNKCQRSDRASWTEENLQISVERNTKQTLDSNIMTKKTLGKHPSLGDILHSHIIKLIDIIKSLLYEVEVCADFQFHECCIHVPVVDHRKVHNFLLQKRRTHIYTHQLNP
ncbi:hypothetical protein QE152_g12388 [Popillia japonica]|uniref:Uncharacterized protein n=1 Tax=Popillia japonica TaxID=7064 RepID=A0AAW1LRE9_POPJA